MDIAIAGGTGTIGARVVVEAQQRGHAVRVLSRSEGVDALTGVGLEEALQGADAVIDVLNAATTNEQKATAFFQRTTRNLAEVGERVEVAHHVLLSIVGIDRAPFGYYAAKRAQEAALRESGRPATIQRATQFHDFAAQLYRQARIGSLHLAVRMRTQPIALDEVATRLVDVAEQPPAGRARDIAGPREEALHEMMRQWGRHLGNRGGMPAITFPGGFGRAMRSGALLPDADAERGTETFAQWLSAQPEG